MKAEDLTPEQREILGRVYMRLIEIAQRKATRERDAAAADEAGSTTASTNGHASHDAGRDDAATSR